MERCSDWTTMRRNVVLQAMVADTLPWVGVVTWTACLFPLLVLRVHVHYMDDQHHARILVGRGVLVCYSIVDRA